MFNRIVRGCSLHQWEETTKIFALILIAFTSPIVCQAAAPEKPGWELSFDDEFDGEKIDPSKWEVQNKGDRLAKNVTVSNGLCHLMTSKDGQDWSTAYLTTKAFRQKYGYFEVRMRIGAATGLNNAFWLYPPRERMVKPGKPDRFEVDIVEAHNPSKINMTLHDWNNDKHVQNGNVYNAKPDLSKDFHVYALEWSESELIWYFDDQEVRRLKHTICNAEEAVLLSTKVLPWAGNITDALIGTSMDVDYVRVYRKK
jgi:beta-glucanase (GH16 family)